MRPPSSGSVRSQPQHSGVGGFILGWHYPAWKYGASRSETVVVEEKEI
jgi:hypothetical protein